MGVLKYVAEKMETSGATTGGVGRDLCAAGKCCVRFIELLREPPYVAPDAVLQDRPVWK